MELEVENTEKYFRFRLKNGTDVSPWARYEQVVLLNGMVGVSPYYCGGDRCEIITPLRFAELCAVK